MAENVLLLCKHNTSTVIVKVNVGSSFRNIVDKLGSKWGNVFGDTILMEYSTPNHPNCVLTDDDDLENLLMVARSYNLSRVDVVVKDNHDQVNHDAMDNGDNNTQQLVVRQEIEQREVNFCQHQEPILMTIGWREGIIEVGQPFEGGRQQFRMTLLKCAIEVGFKFSYVKNDKRRVTAVCALRESKGCLWTVHATLEKANGFFYIKRLNNEHTCGAAVRTSKNERMSSNVVAFCIMDEIRSNPHIRPIEVVSNFKLHYGLDITYRCAWLGVEKAKDSMFGDQSLSYDLLRWYIDATLKNNPGSRLELDYNPGSGRFKRLFVSYNACIHGFNYCRPLLFLDGTFLKGRYKGNLLSATAKDGNSGLYPLAYAIVDSENRDNWHWFLRQLSHVLAPERQITFVSDRNHGLMEALPSVFPQHHHAFCFLHLQNNLKDKLTGTSNAYRDRMVDMFRKAAYAPTPELFERFIRELKGEGRTRVNDFLAGLPPEHYSCAYFKGKRYGEYCSNAAESFNSWISKARHLPVLKLVDTIRCMLMEQRSERRKASELVNLDLCEKMDKKLVKALNFGRTWVVAEANESVFEVKSYPSVFVDINARTCSCVQWQLKRFPCAHAAIAINQTGKNLNVYVEDYYHMHFYGLSYSKAIFPIPTLFRPEVTTEDVVVRPPLSKKQPGRPKKKRIPSRGEKLRQIKCSRCMRYGHHNRKTCKEALRD